MALQPTPRDRLPTRTLDPSHGLRCARETRKQSILRDASQRPATLVEMPDPIRQCLRFLARLIGQGRQGNAVSGHDAACPAGRERRTGWLEKGICQRAVLHHLAPQFALLDVAETTQRGKVVRTLGRRSREQLPAGMQLAQPRTELADSRRRPDEITAVPVCPFDRVIEQSGVFGRRREHGQSGAQSSPQDQGAQ